MICERCGGLKVLDHFYGTAIDVSAWMYDGFRCINCGSITALMRNEGDVYHAPRTERSGRPALSGQAVAGRYEDPVPRSVLLLAICLSSCHLASGVRARFRDLGHHECPVPEGRES